MNLILYELFMDRRTSIILKESFKQVEGPFFQVNIFENYLGAIVNTLVLPVFMKGVFSYSFTIQSIGRHYLWLNGNFNYIKFVISTIRRHYFFFLVFNDLEGPIYIYISDCFWMTVDEASAEYSVFQDFVCRYVYVLFQNVPQRTNIILNPVFSRSKDHFLSKYTG